MDRKSKILLYTFFFLFVGTVMFSYGRYMVFRDFEVIVSEVEGETLTEEPGATGEAVPSLEENTFEGSDDETTGIPGMELPE